MKIAPGESPFFHAVSLAGGYLVVQPTELGRRTNWLYFCRRKIQILKLYFFELYVFKDFLFL